ncbi:MAG TPA: outer membrane beta-barrel protein [Candidatus Binatia bacterium]
MKEKVVLASVFLLLSAIHIPALVVAQERTSSELRTGKLNLSFGIGAQGATADGGAFALGFSGDYFLNHNFSLGPLLQIGISDDLFQIAPTAQAKYTFDVPELPELKPNVQGGIGLIYAELDRRGRPDEDDVSFLIPIGFGADYRLTRDISLGSDLLFNFTDLDVRNEKFFFTWLVGLKIHF